MMRREESTVIVYFKTPSLSFIVLGRGHIGHMVKMHYFFKNLPVIYKIFFILGKDQTN